MVCPLIIVLGAGAIVSELESGMVHAILSRPLARGEYLLGNIGGMVEMIGNYINSKAVNSTGIFLSLVSPFHTLYSTAERILLPSSGLAGEVMRGAAGLTGSGQPASPAMFVYIAIYTLGFLALAARKFGRIDLN